MTTQPIRLLDDPSVALELRDFLQSQSGPDPLPARERDLVQRRIAASVLALPLSLKLGGLISQGTATTGAASSGAVSTGVASGSGAASSAVVSGVASTGTVSTGAVTAAASVGVGNATASGLGLVGASLAPSAAAGGAIASTGLTLAGAKGVVAGLAGAVSVTKGAAVLGVALATGAGASFVAREVTPARSTVVETDGARERTSAPSARQAAQTRSAKTGLRMSGAPREESPEGALREEELARGSGASPERVQVASRSAKATSVPSAKPHASGALSLSDLEDVRHGEGAEPGDGAVTGSNTDGAGAQVTEGRGTASRSGVVSRGATPEVARTEAEQNASERLQEEVTLLRSAQQLLRTDPAMAREALDRYDVTFPQGAMRAEYDVLRRRLENTRAH